MGGERESGVTTGMKVQDVTKEYYCSAAPGKGAVTYGAGYNVGSHRNEMMTAQWLHEIFGGDIVLLTESAERGTKTPDYLWRGRAWELKGVYSINGADKAIQKGIKQIQNTPGGIILNLLDELDMPQLQRQIFGRICRSDIDEVDIIIAQKTRFWSFSDTKNKGRS